MSNNKLRVGVAALTLSAAGMLSITSSEGFSEKAIIPTKGDVPTYGYGSTRHADGSPVRMGETITRKQAELLLSKDASLFSSAIKRCVKVPLSQGEFDAYVSLTYNIGDGAFCRSTLVKRLNAGDYAGACEEIKRWDKMGGRRLRGLTTRRLREYRMCVGGDGQS